MGGPPTLSLRTASGPFSPYTLSPPSSWPDTRQLAPAVGPFSGLWAQGAQTLLLAVLGGGNLGEEDVAEGCPVPI